jgi:hypothetical protein
MRLRACLARGSALHHHVSRLIEKLLHQPNDLTASKKRHQLPPKYSLARLARRGFLVRLPLHGTEQTNRQREHSVCVPRAYNEIYKTRAERGKRAARVVIDTTRNARAST